VSSATPSVSLGQLSSSTSSLSGHRAGGCAGTAVLCEGQEPAQGTPLQAPGSRMMPLPPSMGTPLPWSPHCTPPPLHPAARAGAVRAAGHTGHRHGVRLGPVAPHPGIQPAQLHQGGHGVVEQEQDAGVGVDGPGVAGVEDQGVGPGAVAVQDDVLEAKHPAGTEWGPLSPPPRAGTPTMSQGPVLALA